MADGEVKRVGVHLVADLSGIGEARLQDEAGLMALLASALREAGFHVLSATSHRFPGGGQGVTGLFLLTESHAAFHTYPEIGYLALDLFTCGGGEPRAVLERMTTELAPQWVTTRCLDRTAGG